MLTVDDNKFSDVTHLANLTNPRGLSLIIPAHNQISDLTPLAGLINLEWPNLERNPIGDWSPVEHIEQVHGRPQ